jgi:hypothetical protein
MNCFGMVSREAGQTRVPAPPHMMTGIILLIRPPTMDAVLKNDDRRRLLSSDHIGLKKRFHHSFPGAVGDWAESQSTLESFVFAICF